MSVQYKVGHDICRSRDAAWKKAVLRLAGCDYISIRTVIHGLVGDEEVTVGSGFGGGGSRLPTVGIPEADVKSFQNLSAAVYFALDYVRGAIPWGE